MFAKTQRSGKTLRNTIFNKVTAGVLILVLGITSVVGIAAPAKTEARTYTNYSILDCSYSLRPKLSVNNQHRCTWAAQAFYKFYKNYTLRYYDGIYGNETKWATTLYQTQEPGLPATDPYGVVGPKTWDKMYIRCVDADLRNLTYLKMVCHQGH